MASKLMDGASGECQRLSRRTFFKLTSGAAITGVFGASLPRSLAYAEAIDREKRDKMTPDEILAAFKSGNQNFSKGLRTSRNYINEQKATAKGQYPSAIILSCIDSRAPAEVIMDLGIGDIFNARVAGNIANEDILGSMEFACKVSGAKVVLVMGHTACGAIKGAIDNAELGNLTGLLAKIKPAIKATTAKGEASSKNAAYVDAVAQKKRRADDRRHSQKESCTGGTRIQRHDQNRRSNVQSGKGDDKLFRVMRNSTQVLAIKSAVGE